MINQKYLKEILKYDPETGEFTWLISKKGTAIGTIAGCVMSDSGYRLIGIDYKLYRAHRLAWLYVHGLWPSKEIDHINQCRHDNRIANLREATVTQNHYNKHTNKKNKTGARGVYLSNSGKFKVRMRINGKSTHIGTFEDFYLAELVAIEARDKYHGQFANHG